MDFVINNIHQQVLITNCQYVPFNNGSFLLSLASKISILTDNKLISQIDKNTIKSLNSSNFIKDISKLVKSDTISFSVFTVKLIDISRLNITFKGCNVNNCYKEVLFDSDLIKCPTHGTINEFKYHFCCCITVQDTTGVIKMDVTSPIISKIIGLSANDFNNLPTKEVFLFLKICLLYILNNFKFKKTELLKNVLSESKDKMAVIKTKLFNDVNFKLYIAVNIYQIFFNKRNVVK